MYIKISLYVIKYYQQTWENSLFEDTNLAHSVLGIKTNLSLNWIWSVVGAVFNNIYDWFSSRGTIDGIVIRLCTGHPGHCLISENSRRICILQIVQAGSLGYVPNWWIQTKKLFYWNFIILLFVKRRFHCSTH